MSDSNTTSNCPDCGQIVPSQGPCENCHDLAETLPDLSSGNAQSWAPGGAIRYFGDYEILEEIARGGMGVVFKARQASLNRVVAIKMILSARLADEMAIRRFHVEAEAAAKLQHPNIVGVHEVGEHDGQHYFSMDYIEGQSLATMLESGPLPASLAASYLQRLALAMQYAHERGVLHRDLKPSNVIIDQDGTPRITDFGLAKIESDIDDLTKSGSIMGSIHYMAPEQASGRVDAIGVRSDVYALGAMLYEMLAGRPPHKAATLPATLKQVLEAEPVSIRKLNPVIPTELEIIVMKCLEKSPARRYASASELAGDLERFLARQPIQARKAGRIQRIEAWVARHPWRMAGVLTVGFVGMLYLTYGLWQQSLHTLWKADPSEHSGLPSEFASHLEKWLFWSQAVLFPVFALWLFYQKHSRGIKWIDFLIYQQKFLAAEEKPVAPDLRAVMLVSGSMATILGLYLASQVIRARVWDVSINATLVIMVPTLVVLGILTIFMALKNRRLDLYGAPIVGDEPMPDLVRQEIRENATPSAMALYHTMRPDLTSAECRATVQRWANEMQEADPRAFEKPISHKIPMRSLMLGTLIVLTVLVITAYTFPLASPTWWLLCALCAVVAGVSGAIGIETTTIRKRILITLPGAIAFTALLALAKPLGHDGISFAGFTTGLTWIVVMLSLLSHLERRRLKDAVRPDRGQGNDR